MVDRVNLFRLINAILETERRNEKKVVEKRNENLEDKVTLSEMAKELITEESKKEESEKKVGEIKKSIEKGNYKIQEEKILEGFMKFFR
ncbi:MAG TPA: flagellar biosynthesis anti-sigma factor FlgM [Aquifex aeolicus]|nr:flagellar biosynthesis anti-sigma factor FlgM [Aquifex aeolicus]